MKQKFLPESLYNIDSSMSYNKLNVFYKNNSTITGKVIRLDLEGHRFEVDLGGRFTGIMPFADATIYPIYKEDGNISANLYSLVGKTIQARIYFMEGDNILISRKSNMLEALEVLKRENNISFACITSFSQASAFFDIGGGIIGRSFGKDFSTVKFNNVKDVGLSVGEIIPVSILGTDETGTYFNLSRVEAQSDYRDDLKEGDVVSCKVFGNVTEETDNTGYFVLINKSETPYDNLATLVINNAIGETLSQIKV